MKSMYLSACLLLVLVAMVPDIATAYPVLSLSLSGPNLGWSNWLTSYAKNITTYWWPTNKLQATGREAKGFFANDNNTLRESVANVHTTATLMSTTILPPLPNQRQPKQVNSGLVANVDAYTMENVTKNTLEMEKVTTTIGTTPWPSEEVKEMKKPGENFFLSNVATTEVPNLAGDHITTSKPIETVEEVTTLKQIETLEGIVTTTTTAQPQIKMVNNGDHDNFRRELLNLASQPQVDEKVNIANNVSVNGHNFDADFLGSFQRYYNNAAIFKNQMQRLHNA